MNHDARSAVDFGRDFSHANEKFFNSSFARQSIYSIFKFCADKLLAVISLPFILVISALLLVLNPILNSGPLFFSQQRMGLGGQRFKMLKFRTMSVASEEARAHDAQLETHRITPFANYLRKFRIDELPNFFNVLAGEMSVVGPRPDAWEHSIQYSKTIKYYGDRFQVRPGITGLAQVCGGYADTKRAVQRKARFDRFYVTNRGAGLDIYIMIRTFAVILTGFGAK